MRTPYPAFKETSTSLLENFSSSESDVSVSIFLSSSAIGIRCVSPYFPLQMTSFNYKSMLEIITPRAAGAIILCHRMGNVDADTLDMFLGGGSRMRASNASDIMSTSIVVGDF